MTRLEILLHELDSTVSENDNKNDVYLECFDGACGDEVEDLYDFHKHMYDGIILIHLFLDFNRYG